MYNTSLKILKMIEENGFKAYIVGGYPRDIYLQRTSTDVDICTSATPKDLKEIFKNAMLPSVQYGSVTVILNKIHFEITTFRKEIKYQDNRLPIKIKYITNLVDDLKRRDFTINTLCIDSNGNLIDLLDSTKDLDNKVIKMVGNPKYRLKEDALRILRALRFATILDFELDNNLKKYIKKYSYLLKKLSYYRKKEELDKIFSSVNVKKGIDLILELGLDKDLEIPKIKDVIITSSIIGIWAQLDVLNTYGLSNNEKELIIKINELLDKDPLDNINLYNYGLYISSVVSEIKGISKKLTTSRYNKLAIKSRKELTINGKDICNILNKQDGAYLRKILIDLETKIINNELENNKEVLEKYIISNYL